MSDPLDSTCGRCRFWRKGECRRRLLSHLFLLPAQQSPHVRLARANQPPMQEMVPSPISYYPPAGEDFPSCGEFEPKDGAPPSRATKGE